MNYNGMTHQPFMLPPAVEAVRDYVNRVLTGQIAKEGLAHYAGLLAPQSYADYQADGYQPAPVTDGLLGELMPGPDLPVSGLLGHTSNMTDTLIRLFRGESTANKAGRFYTPDVEFARQFTKSGLDSEIIEGVLRESQIFTPKQLPFAGDEGAVSKAVQAAKKAGKFAVRLSEGGGQPPSVFMINRFALKGKKAYQP